MKRSITLVFLLIFTTLSGTPTHAAQTLAIGVAYDIGGRGDRSFNDAAAAGLDKAQKQLSFTVESVVTDGSSADREKRIRALVAKNCNPIIAIGSGYGPTLQALSIEFPSVQFAIINDASVSALNVTSVIFADTQGAYLAGFSAAQISKTGKVAMIANPNQADIYKDGFSAGVFASKKRVIPIVKYVSGSFSVATKDVIGAGADVVFVTTQGSDSEIFKAIVANNLKKKSTQVSLINIEPDQYITVSPTTQKYLVASVVKRVDKAIYDIIAKAVNGGRYLDFIDANAGIYGHRYSITGGGIEFTLRSSLLTKLRDSINAEALVAEKIPA